jgi:hypothetical protein
LDFIIATGSVIETRAPDGVDFIEEDDTGLFAPSHLEQLPHHSSALTDIFLNKFRTNHPNKGGIRSVGNCAGTESLSRTRWTKKEDTLWWVDSKTNEPFGLTVW